ncbi:riboflavin biosynthesis protein RibD [Alicyclobacillus cellulosilyticus]|uniref:Riboflavin biosynthesis protein RibD n=1 Tax=Alicyclobacillus cellulosilyticus TaxID=1003997 RepID=A0A917NKK0_9BACL|nr:bifunctional diaminohydroxyphosphoribosylaminopyrimidine deaminase/5-amino-6-(5-phosphoribosylamino)uracil reductase RibD [Alicyclobacillus cellulosilyticus]GGJ07767.1 riboflavin biosynthesis protein RibD [Alicyclobacillus cellulosilyticus]
MSEDERYMALALELAEMGRGQTSPNPVVGALVVNAGRIVGQGAHLYAGGPHAEVYALQMAGEAAKGATVYVTLEPCSHFGRTPPCAEALIAAGVRRVVVGCVDPNPEVAGRGIARLRAAGIDVVVGVLEARARRQNEAFFTWVTKRRPWVIWKCAATLDGRIATAAGDSFYVTGPKARAQVQALRRQVAAVAVGIETALADDPRLTVRPAAMGADAGEAERGSGHAGEDAVRTAPAASVRQPVRVVFDSSLRLPPSARMLQEPGRTVVICRAMSEAAAEDGGATEAAGGAGGNPQASRAAALARAGAEVIPVPAGPDGHVDLHAALRALADIGIDSVLVEGGGRLAGALLRAQLIDQVVYYVAPKLLGGGRPALAGEEPARMADAVALCDVSVEVVGQDVRITGYPVYP